MISLGQSSLYASLHLPQTPAEIIPGRINGNRPSPTTIGAARALPLRVDPLLRSLSLPPDPKNRLPGELSTFPALFPLVSSPERCHTPPARLGPDHLA